MFIEVLAFLLPVAGVLTLAFALNLIWCREQVKKDLQIKGCAPISVQWRPHPFADWAVFYPATIAFRVTYIDPTGCIQTGRCAVHTWFHSVYWVSDTVAYLNRNLSWIGRCFYFVAALFFLWFGISHLITNSLAWPRAGHRPIQWHGWPVILLSLASLFCALNLLLNVLFHRMTDTRERHWILTARAIGFVGWILFAASFVVALYRVFRIGAS